ncbi:hypothetical protein F8568_032985 [Actinomadura sp. LD22]|uniref:Uncharacterized protein n=1 Tax=Actinomadura physcomitrii TaxID=2650748 RepID=A0A6I4MMB5_9ACTN|nr:hypothetical protein [Actinomadura physcomitrii]MWA05097.1 hypothetical protein [Actinomadura physcomitrii]
MGAIPVVLPDGLSGRPVAAQIEREFSGVWAWYGEATGSWWAMVRLGGEACLLEALNPDELRNAIVHARGRPWPG